MSDLGGKGAVLGQENQSSVIPCLGLNDFVIIYRWVSSAILGKVVFLYCCSNRVLMVRGTTETGCVDGEKAFHRNAWVQESVHEGLTQPSIIGFSCLHWFFSWTE